MATLLERVDAINLKRLTEGTREDILRSFFSLCKTNGGRYKSEKQAAFLKSHLEDGSFFITQVLSFGTSTASQRKVDWNVVCDDMGVVKITKHTTSKGEELYWARDGEQGARDSIAAKNTVRDEKNKVHKRADLEAIISQLKSELTTREDELEKAKNAIDNPAAASVRDYLISRLPHYEQQAQEIRDLIARHEASLQNI